MTYFPLIMHIPFFFISMFSLHKMYKSLMMVQQVIIHFITKDVECKIPWFIFWVLCMAMVNGHGFNFWCGFIIEVAMGAMQRSACKIEHWTLLNVCLIQPNGSHKHFVMCQFNVITFYVRENILFFEM